VCRFEFFDHFDLGTIDDFDHKDFVDLFPADHAIRFQYEIVYGASIAHASVAAGVHDCITILLVTNFAQSFFRGEGDWQGLLAGSCFFMEIVR
jgi:hypothetical protein